MIREVQLHAFWKLHAKAIRCFSTIDGKTIHIEEEGIYNQNQGPDFINAYIYIEGIRWFGNIEFHVKTSDWFQHKHQYDHHYRPVILHVVWKNDSSLYTHSPVVELERILSISHLSQYNSNTFKLPFACSTRLSISHDFQNYLDDFSRNRLKERSLTLIHLWRKHRCWEVICWHRMCRIIGGIQNGEAFTTLAESIPYAVIRILKYDLNKVLALLLGQSGLLYSEQGNKVHELLDLYIQITLRFGLVRPNIQFVFLRMIPSSFPQNRIHYLAKLIYNYPQWIEQFAQIESKSDWNHFLQNSKFKLSKQLENSILINLIIPMCYAKSIDVGKCSISDYLNWMDSLPPEKNAIVKRYRDMGISIDNAKRSQGVLELFKRKCEKSRCNGCPRSINLAN